MTGESLDEQVYRCLARRDHAGAERILAARLQAAPEDARACFLLGRVAGERGDRETEMEMTRRAAERAPASSEYRAQLGRCHALRGEAQAALAAADAAAADPMASDLTLDVIAATHTMLHQHEAAAAMLQRAVDEGSANPAIWFNLATARKFCGDFAAAAIALERAIAIAPGYIKARNALSALRPATPERNQIADYRALLDHTTDPVAALQICHAAARECEALGRYDEAFSLLARGKQAMLAANGYRFSQDEAVFGAVRDSFADVAPASGVEDAAPIFVVGMPRSGTTVVDRILSAHPDVASVGESLQMPILLQHMAGRRSMQLIDPASARPLAAARDMRELGAAYLASLPPLGGASRPLDKFHLNSLLVGFIIRAFPRAKIICIHRGGADTVVGNYRQAFEYHSGIYRYALSLDAIAHYYVAFRRLADFWAARFPDNFLQLSYDGLVSHPATLAPRMFDFCGLSWDARYLRIEENEAPVATASALQVRQPLNTASIGQWRRYAAHMGEALSILRDAGFAD